MPTILDAARDAYAAGLCIVPPREDGSKRPVGSWAPYQTHRPDKATLRGWWGPSAGLGVIAGAVSGGLEVLEFDDSETYRAYLDVARASGIGDLVDRLEQGYVEDTPSGGVHWLYRCAEIDGNTKLATRPGAQSGFVDTLIETRGEGGYCILAPSGGPVHPTGQAYVLRAGSFATIPTLTSDERATLHMLARTFHVGQPEAAPHAKLAETQAGRPGDAFAAVTTWRDILEPAGWAPVLTRGGTDYWRRPGKERGISATTNYGGSDLLIVFSTSTPFDTGRGYGKFSAYAKLFHADDYAEAARALAGLGYGEPATGAHASPDNPLATDASTASPGPDSKAAKAPPIVPIRAALTAYWARVTEGPPPVVPTPFSDLNWLFNGGFAPGELIFIGARPGVGKTALALELARYAARTVPTLFVSREMVLFALMRRLLAQDARVSASALRRHEPNANEQIRALASMERMKDLLLYLTDAASSLTDIRRLLDTPPPNAAAWGLLVVDYLQLVRAPADIKDRRLQVEAVSLGLKGMALRHHLPVICLTSLRRPQQGNARPTTADLRESGELEHDADLILLLHKPDEHGLLVEVHVAKNRDGETGNRTLVFDPQFVSFAQMERA